MATGSVKSLATMQGEIDALNSDITKLKGTNDVYLGTGTNSIPIKTTPALIVIRGSGNSASAIIITNGSSVHKVFENVANSIENLSISNNVITAKFNYTCGYSVLY